MLNITILGRRSSVQGQRSFSKLNQVHRASDKELHADEMIEVLTL